MSEKAKKMIMPTALSALSFWNFYLAYYGFFSPKAAEQRVSADEAAQKYVKTIYHELQKEGDEDITKEDMYAYDDRVRETSSNETFQKYFGSEPEVDPEFVSASPEAVEAYDTYMDQFSYAAEFPIISAIVGVLVGLGAYSSFRSNFKNFKK